MSEVMEIDVGKAMKVDKTIEISIGEIIKVSDECDSVDKTQE